jgi:hypothetical protein
MGIIIDKSCGDICRLRFLHLSESSTFPISSFE